MELDKKRNLVERATWENTQGRDGQEVIVTPNWVQITSPFAPTPFMNGVLRCELPEHDIDLRVRHTVLHFRAKGLPFRWKIVPSTRPADLGQRLEQNGMVLKEKLFGLYAEPGELKIASNPKVRVEAVTLQNLEAWLAVQANAWKVPPLGIEYQRRSMTEALKNGGRYENYLACLDGEPVGSAAMCVNNDYVYLMGGAVNEAHRGQGVYRTLTAHRLQRIAELGLPAVVHCLEKTSAPICLKLGFEKICEIHSFEPAN